MLFKKTKKIKNCQHVLTLGSSREAMLQNTKIQASVSQVKSFNVKLALKKMGNWVLIRHFWCLGPQILKSVDLVYSETWVGSPHWRIWSVWLETKSFFLLFLPSWPLSPKLKQLASSYFEASSHGPIRQTTSEKWERAGVGEHRSHWALRAPLTVTGHLGVNVTVPRGAVSASSANLNEISGPCLHLMRQ